MISTRSALLVLLAVFLVIGAFIRLSDLATYYYSPDEIKALVIAERSPLVESWNEGLTSAHPPSFYFLLRAMLFIDDGRIFMRSVSWLPGLGLILVFFLLGRRIFGTAAGVVMAFMATFGFGGLMISEVVRGYALSMFLLALGLYFLHDHIERGGRRALLGYLLSMSVASACHYFAALPLAVIGLVSLGGWILDRERRPRFRLLFVIHFVVLSLGAGFVLFLMRQGVMGSFREALSKSYLSYYYPDDLSDLIFCFRDFLSYITLAPETGREPDGTWMALIALLGFPPLFRKSRRHLFALTLTLFALSVALAFFRIYPLGGVRQSMYLFPMTALLAGGAAHFLWGLLVNGVIRTREAPRWFPVLGTILVLGLSFGYTAFISGEGFLRRYALTAVAEFPLVESDYRDLVGHLERHAGSGDVVLANRQATKYLLHASGTKKTRRLSGKLNRMDFNGLRTFFIDAWYFESLERVDRAMTKLNKRFRFDEGRRVWLINLGWADPVLPRILELPLEKKTVLEEVLRDGGFLFALDGKAWAER